MGGHCPRAKKRFDSSSSECGGGGLLEAALGVYMHVYTYHSDTEDCFCGIFFYKHILGWKLESNQRRNAEAKSTATETDRPRPIEKPKKPRER